MSASPTVRRRGARHQERQGQPLTVLADDFQRACAEQEKEVCCCANCGGVAFGVWRSEAMGTTGVQCLVCGSLRHLAL
jgi:hypothetical protein